jgi:PAS domain S-box-containing protein
MKQLKVLIVEDSDRDAALLLRELQKAGYTVVCRRVDTADDMKSALDSGNWDIVLSDYVMPRFSGMSAIKIVQQFDPNLPLIVISGQIGEDTAVDAMKAGAHDFILKGNLTRLGPAIERELADADNRRRRKKAEDELENYHARLEQLVNERTAQLTETNKKLEQEIAEHQKTEQELKEAESEAAALIKYAPTGIYELDYSGPRFVSINDAMCVLSGYTKEELYAMNPADLLDDDGKRKFAERTLKQLAGEKIDESVEFRIRKKDGNFIYASMNVALSSTKPNTALVIAHDITDHKLAEARIKDIADKYQSLFDNTADGVWIHNLDGTILEVNNAYCRMSGYTRDEIVGKPIKLFEVIESPEEIEKHIRTLLEKGHDRFDSKHRRKDGNEFDIDITALYLGEERGEIAIFMRDITERKKVEQLKDEFIGMVSHELKTPLTVIMGALSTAADERVSAEQARELLGDAVSHAKILGDIIENLLELSRQQSDRLVINPVPTEVEEIVGNVITSLAARSDKHILINEISTALPNIKADPLRVERILHNLVDNAIKYSPDGGEVKIFARQERDFIVIGVSDQGLGIAKDDQERLFQSFERLGVAVKKSIQGTGLGLRVCRILVEAHGGKIWVESERGKGSTFYFSLPVDK